MAASIFFIHLFGDLVSQPIVGVIADAFHDVHAICTDARGLRIGMCLLPLALGLSALAWFRGAARRACHAPR